jgi:hypothetical protein
VNFPLSRDTYKWLSKAVVLVHVDFVYWNSVCWLMFVRNWQSQWMVVVSGQYHTCCCQRSLNMCMVNHCHFSNHTSFEFSYLRFLCFLAENQVLQWRS